MPKTRRWFVQQGTSFTNAFATTPLCCPSRASIFTGRYAHNHGVLDSASATLLDQRSTLQRYLQESGYRTAIAGKFLNEWDLTANPPFFDRWAIFRDNVSYSGIDFNVDGAIQDIEGYSTGFVENQSLRFLDDFERDDRRPWLLYVAPLAPHKPFTPEAKYANVPVPIPGLNPAMMEKDLTDRPPFLQDREVGLEGSQHIRTQQARTLMSVDDLVGRVMTSLQSLGELDRTMAFYLSDNGFLAGEHGLVDKRLPYEQSGAVPFILRWDGQVPAAAEDDRLVANVDVTPTALAAAGASPAEGFTLDGRNLLGPVARSRLFTEYFVDPVRPVPEWAAMRTTEFLYAEYYSADGTRIFREFYDLIEDPWEVTNLLGDDSQVNDPSSAMLERLERQLAFGRRCTGTTGPNPCP